MKQRFRLVGRYSTAPEFEAQWRDIAATAGARESICGRSVEGRPLWRFDMGSRAPDAPVIMLTALIHGVEMIGSVALLDVVSRLATDDRGLFDRARVVVVPMVNADALANNMDRLHRGRIAFQRKNANGVDLNRNFPSVAAIAPRHPFAGSTWRWSPHYRGPAPLSEPESRAVRDVAMEARPSMAVGFHSFGNLLLYPWAWTRALNPRFPRYKGLARSFVNALEDGPYRCRQAIEYYPTVGDLDDWLDATFGTLAFTVEVGGLDRRLFNPRRFINPFCWMNPVNVEGTVRALSPGVVGLLTAAASSVGLSRVG